MIFDDFDIFYLANELTPVQLRREIQHAEIQSKVDEIFAGTPYADPRPFPWADYTEACQTALKCQQAQIKPAKYSKHIDFEAIKARVDILSVVEGYTKLRKSGHNRYIGVCPLHEDKHPSLTVYADQGSWYCFSCNKGGDIFAFIKSVNNCDFKTALAILGGA